jgi:AraC-like DNA-binding protein
LLASISAGMSIWRHASGFDDVGGLSAQRTRELLSDGKDDVVLHIHETGRRIVSQLGREAAVEPGGGLVTSNSDTSIMVLPEPTHFASIGVPRKLMMALVPDLEDTLVRPLSPDAGVLRLLVHYLDILEDKHALRTPELRHAVATHIHDLCALAIGATRDAAEIAKGRGLRAARLRAIKADIVQNLSDGDVSAAALALRQRVTPRYIHKLFESEGMTLSRFVLYQPLARVHRMLTDPRHTGLTIGAIAYRVGFGDLSTFNREFRRHFGHRRTCGRRRSSKRRPDAARAHCRLRAAPGHVVVRLSLSSTHGRRADAGSSGGSAI